MRWEIEVTDQFIDWYRNLTDDERDRVGTAIDMLEER